MNSVAAACDHEGRIVVDAVRIENTTVEEGGITREPETKETSSAFRPLWIDDLDEHQIAGDQEAA